MATGTCICVCYVANIQTFLREKWVIEMVREVGGVFSLERRVVRKNGGLRGGWGEEEVGVKRERERERISFLVPSQLGLLYQYERECHMHKYERQCHMHKYERQCHMHKYERQCHMHKYERQ